MADIPPIYEIGVRQVQQDGVPLPPTGALNVTGPELVAVNEPETATHGRRTTLRLVASAAGDAAATPGTLVLRGGDGEGRLGGLYTPWVQPSDGGLELRDEEGDPQATVTPEGLRARTVAAPEGAPLSLCDQDVDEVASIDRASTILRVTPGRPLEIRDGDVVLMRVTGTGDPDAPALVEFYPGIKLGGEMAAGSDFAILDNATTTRIGFDADEVRLNAPDGSAMVRAGDAKLGFFGAAAASRPIVSGSTGTVAQVIQALGSLGLLSVTP